VASIPTLRAPGIKISASLAQLHQALRLNKYLHPFWGFDRPLFTNCSPSFDSQALVTSASNNKFLMPSIEERLFFAFAIPVRLSADSRTAFAICGVV
jgi:hypothetical protein